MKVINGHIIGKTINNTYLLNILSYTRHEDKTNYSLTNTKKHTQNWTSQFFFLYI